MKAHIRAAIVRLFGNVFFTSRYSPHNHPRGEYFRVYVQGLRLKFLLSCGFGVVMVGRCASGKSVMLEKALPGRVVTPDREAILSGKLGAFDMTKMPAGMFALDESIYFDRTDLVRAFPELRKRQVVFAMQALGHTALVNLGALFEGRLAIIYLGNPDEYLRELNQFMVNGGG
ncbi:hypothetical protein [Pseudomonas sp. MWU12-2323]|uniref:hypothetical protein n=1 Tax=Pseudomonas sp. MWU12-2323 TaxID=2651296 RepID=UPI00128ADE92|nr:hypothetical protein [Pseudomonas sp. MWU12-2323]MPQ71445.1 hypothetical protein [Pseudomonas sp. MWU12-2323]